MLGSLVSLSHEAAATIAVISLVFNWLFPAAEGFPFSPADRRAKTSVARHTDAYRGKKISEVMQKRRVQRVKIWWGLLEKRGQAANRSLQQEEAIFFTNLLYYGCKPHDFQSFRFSPVSNFLMSVLYCNNTTWPRGGRTNQMILVSNKIKKVLIAWQVP